MTVRELLLELQRIVSEDSSRMEDEVTIYVGEAVSEEDFEFENAYAIDSVDDTLTDRVDLNLDMGWPEQ